MDEVLACAGRPLDPNLQADMGQRFGHDFSQVRIHSDALAQRSAHEVKAQAYTVGSDVVFAAGRFRPESGPGRRLLAHELSHVVQQGEGGRVLQRAPANYTAGPTQPGSAPVKTQPLTPDEWLGLLETYRRTHPQEFLKLLIANEQLLYPYLQPHGFHGSWTNDADYLKDFDAAIARWGMMAMYNGRFVRAVSSAPAEKPKTREERRYENANYLVRDMNRRGYGRGSVNDALESYGLMDDLVSHGFEKRGAHSFKNHVEYKYEAIAALNAYIDRYDAEHGNRRQTSANVPSQGEDVAFYRAWLEGWGYVTSSLFASMFAGAAMKFTDDPKKITGAAGVGAAFEGAVSSVAGGSRPSARYEPKVVGPQDRPTAAGSWRYAKPQPTKPIVPDAHVGAVNPGSPPTKTPLTKPPPPDKPSSGPPPKKTLVASPPPPPANPVAQRPPAKTIKSFSPPPPKVPGSGSGPRRNGPTPVTDVEVVRGNLPGGTGVTSRDPQAHRKAWVSLGGAANQPAPPAFRAPDGTIHVSSDHPLMGAPGGNGIPPVSTQRPGSTSPSPVKAPVQSFPPSPPVRPMRAPAKPPPKQIEPPREVTPQEVEAIRNNRVPPVKKGRGSGVNTSNNAADHQTAWEMNGGGFDKAPPAFIYDGQVYLDPSRWPPK